jgi:hypothetical protein
MGGALGLAVLASAASARTHALARAGHSTAASLTGGYHVAFAVGAVFAVAAAVIGAALLRNRSVPHAAAELDPAFEAA